MVRHQGRIDRYDGYSFRVFRNDPADSTSLRDNHVLVIHEDRAGLLWVGTNSGLDVFDPATEVFRHFPCGDAASDALSPHGPYQCATNIITEDPAGHLWVSAGQGLYRITPDRGDPAITGSGTRIDLVGESTGMDMIWMTVDEWGVLRGSWAPTTGGLGVRTFTFNTRDEARIAAMIADPFGVGSVLFRPGAGAVLCGMNTRSTAGTRYLVIGGNGKPGGRVSDRHRASQRGAMPALMPIKRWIS